MSEFNPIGWTHFTINYWWGCSEVSPACAHCYAREWAKFTSKKLFGWVVEWGQGKPRAQRLEAARAEAMALDRQAAKRGVRYRVFNNSMSDTLDEEVPIKWLAWQLETIRLTPNLDHQILTKRPQNFDRRMIQVSDFWESTEGGNLECFDWLENQWFAGHPPHNVWFGITAEDQPRFNERCPRLSPPRRTRRLKPRRKVYPPKASLADAEALAA